MTTATCRGAYAVAPPPLPARSSLTARAACGWTRRLRATRGAGLRPRPAAWALGRVEAKGDGDDPVQRRKQRRKAQERLRDDVAGKLGVPPRLVEAVAVTSLVGLTAAAAASVLAFALPAVLLASTALPGLLFMLFVLLSMGALVSTFVPVLKHRAYYEDGGRAPRQLVFGGGAVLSLVAGLVLPALFAAVLGIGLVWVLGGGSSTVQDDDKADYVVEVEAEEAEAEEAEAERLRSELAEFDRRLLGDARRWSVDDVATWLQQSGYNELVDNFVSNQVDGVTLLTLDTDELRVELGVAALADRRALMSSISSLKATNTTD